MLLLILTIVLLIIAAFWSGMIVNTIDGPTLLAQDGSGNICIIEDKKLLVSDPNGELIESHPLRLYGIDEPLADFHASREGDIIVGLRDSNVIKEYRRDGGEPLVYNITPVAKVMKGYGAYFHFTMDEDRGTLYVTDSGDGALRIYDNTDTLVKTLRTPSGATPNIKQVSGDSPETFGQLLNNIRNVMPSLMKRADVNAPYNWPNTVVLSNGRIYVADTNNFRIIRMDIDGRLDKIILVNPLKNSSKSGRITSFSVYGGKIYALLKNTVIMGGALVEIDPGSDSVKEFALPVPKRASFDPDDVLATDGGVFVSDSDAFSIYKFSPEGEYEGTFGGKSLKTALKRPKTVIYILSIVRWGALALAMLLLISLALINKRLKQKTRSSQA